jgi:hypothetical protein
MAYEDDGLVRLDGVDDRCEVRQQGSERERPVCGRAPAETGAIISSDTRGAGDLVVGEHPTDRGSSEARFENDGWCASALSENVQVVDDAAGWRIAAEVALLGCELQQR